jgi:hypothetical protein
MSKEEMTELRRLLGKWIEHIRSISRDHKVIACSDMTYAYINAVCQHMGLGLGG